MVAVVFSPDGRYLATGSRDGIARLWDTRDGREQARLVLGEAVWAVAFSPDGRYLATGSRDGTARVWEVASGREVARVTQGADVNTVAFSPDGRYLATGSDDHTARLWIWQTVDPVAEACARLPRSLTPEEWRQYLGDEPYRPACGAPPS